MNRACVVVVMCLLLFGSACSVSDRCTNEYETYATFRDRLYASHDCRHGGIHTLDVSTLACGRPDRSIVEWRMLHFTDEATFLVNFTKSELLYASTDACSFGDKMTLDDVLAQLTFDEYTWCQRVEQRLCE